MDQSMSMIYPCHGYYFLVHTVARAIQCLGFVVPELRVPPRPNSFSLGRNQPQLSKRLILQKVPSLKKICTKA